MNKFERLPNRLKIILGLFAFFLPVVLYAFQIPFLQSCFNLQKSLLIYSIGGGIIGFVIAYFAFIKKQREDSYKLQIGVAGIVVGFFLFPLLAILLNRAIVVNQEILKADVVAVEAYHQSRFGKIDGERKIDGYFIHLVIDQKLHRLQSSSKGEIQELSEGSILEVIQYSGILGMKWGELISLEAEI